MASGLRILPDVIRTVNSTAFTGAYQKIGAPLTYASCLIKFVNNSNVLITISWDGVNDHDIAPANSFCLYDIASDAGAQRGLYVEAGTQFWVKGAAAGTNSGTVYLVIFHTSEY